MNEIQFLKKLHITTILIGLVGFFVSLYALIAHVQILLKPGHGLLCDVNAHLSCSTVMSSAFSEFASIPLGAYGMTYFVILLAAAFLPKYANVTPKQLSQYEFFVSFVGLVVVSILFSISYFSLKIFCPVCVAIYGLVVLYTFIKIISFIRHKSHLHSAQNDVFLKFMAVSLCLGVPPLAAGLMAPFVLDKFFLSPKTETKNKTEVKTTESTTQVPVDLKKQMLAFNKTNYVGNGEDYRKGNDDAKVVVQMFSDFGCPHCKDANKDLLNAQEIFGDQKVLIVYRFFPLSSKCNPFVTSPGWYPYACPLAVAVRCAGQQGKFWEFKEWAFAGQDLSDQDRAQKFSPEGMKQEARTLNINPEQFMQCNESNVEMEKIKADAALANKWGIQGTPLIVINGVEYKGPHSVDDFVRAFQMAATD